MRGMKAVQVEEVGVDAMFFFEFSGETEYKT